MKQQVISYKKGLAAGLRPDARQGRGYENLVRCVGLVPDDGSLIDVESETFIDASSLGCTFPYPQIFVLSDCTLVCDEDAIYTYDGTSFTLQLSGLTKDQPWTVADFNTFIFMTNGTETVVRNPETLEFIAVNNQETPAGECVCGTASQIIWGGPDLTMLDMGIVPYNDALPPVPDSLSLTYDGTTLTATWTMTESVADLKGYRLAYSPGIGALYQQMTPLHSGVIPSETYSLAVNLTLAGFYTVAIVAVDNADQESIPLYKESLYGYFDFRARGWPGTFTGSYIDEYNWLTATDGSTFEWAGQTTWTGFTSWRPTYSVYSNVLYTSEVIDVERSAYMEFTLGFNISGTNLDQIVARLYYSEDGSTWSQTFLFFASTAFHPKVTCRYFKVELAIVDSSPSSFPIHVKACNISANYVY